MANFFRSILLRLQNKSVTAGTSDTSVSADSGYDGLGTVTVSPTPTETKSATPSTTAQTITPTSGKYLSSVSISAIQTQTKSVTPTKSAQTVTPDSGKYLTSVSVAAVPTETKSQTASTSTIEVTPSTSSKFLSKVTIQPQQHTSTYTPAANKAKNDMGAIHSARYVNTSGMIVPSGAKSITANGTGIDVSSYSTANVNVPNPTLSGDAAVGNVLSGKTFYNSSYTKQTGTMTNNGAFEGDIDPSVSTTYELSPGYYSSIELDVLPHTEYSPSSSTYTQLAMGEFKSIDLGQYHKYRYVNVEAEAPPTLSGDAAVGNVLSGKTFYNSDYTKRTGTMTNNGAVSPTALSAGGSYTVPAGYHNGSGVVSAKTLASQTGVDSGKTAIDASHVHSGYQGWVNGNKVSGTYTPPTITSLTPSDSSPVALETTKNYNPTSGGYAIENNPTTLTPDNTSPATITSGTIYRASDNGYAYKTQPTAALQTTTIWTNSAPTSAFSAQEVTLQNGAKVDDYDFLRFTFRQSSSYSTTHSVVVEVSEFKTHKYGTYPMFLTMVYQRSSSSATKAGRIIAYVSNTQIRIGGVSPIDSTTSQSGGFIIPQTIEGLKLVVQ